MTLVEIIKRFWIQDSEKDFWYDKCNLLGRSWCNLNLMNNYCIDKNSSLWGKSMLTNFDLRSTLQTNELFFAKFGCICQNFTF